MTGSDGDFGLLSPVSASPFVAALTGDRAVLAAILAVESAWASTLEHAGLAPAGSAAVVTQAADAGRYDVAAIAERAQGGANPVIPLLADLRRHVKEIDAAHYGGPVGAGAAVHTSLTSQDVLDSALMLLARNVRTVLLAEVRHTTAALAALAEEHADTLCVGRSLTQHALPYTFGLKAAQWFHGLAAAARNLESLELPVQFGGAGGTLAAASLLAAGSVTGDAVGADTASRATAFTLAEDLAARLDLAAAPAPWHTNRLFVTALGDALAGLAGAFGKIAADLVFLSRPELGELGEPKAAGRGVSSAMPQKQNPVLSVLIRSAALQAPGLAAQLHLAAATFNDERPDGAWHSEWPALRQLLSLVLGAAGHLRELSRGLQVFPGAMRRNLDLAGPLLLSERIGAAVAPLLASDKAGGPDKTERPDKTEGKARLQEIVDRTLQAPQQEQAATYAKLLREAVPADRLSDSELAALLDPAGYLGEAREISRRIVAAYPEFAQPDLKVPALSPELTNTQTKGAHRG